MAAYRRFNKEDGTMEIEPISMSEEERKDFNEWFFWYGVMIHRFRPELETLRRRFKKAKLQYDLREL